MNKSQFRRTVTGIGIASNHVSIMAVEPAPVKRESQEHRPPMKTRQRRSPRARVNQTLDARSRCGWRDGPESVMTATNGTLTLSGTAAGLQLRVRRVLWLTGPQMPP